MSYYSEKELMKIGFKSFGNDVKLSRKASIYNPSNICIGNNVRIDDFCIISAGKSGVQLGSHIHIGAYTSLIGDGLIKFDDFVNISSRVSIYSSNDDYSGTFMTSPMFPRSYTNVSAEDVILEKHVIIGCGSIILPGSHLKTGVAIGAMSFVNEVCEPFYIYAGIPLRFLKKRNRDLLMKELDFLNDYNLQVNLE